MNLHQEIERRCKAHRERKSLQRRMIMNMVEQLQYEGSLAEEADRKLHTLVGITDGILEFIEKSEIHRSFYAEDGAVKDIAHVLLAVQLILSRVSPKIRAHLVLDAAE